MNKNHKILLSAVISGVLMIAFLFLYISVDIPRLIDETSIPKSKSRMSTDVIKAEVTNDTSRICKVDNNEMDKLIAEIKNVFLDFNAQSSGGVAYSSANLIHTYRLDPDVLSKYNIKFIEIEKNLFKVNSQDQDDSMYRFYNKNKSIFIRSNYQRPIETQIISFYDATGTQFDYSVTNSYKFSTYDEFVKSDLWGDDKKWNIKNSNGKLKIVPPVSAKKFEYKFNRSIPNDFKITMKLKNISIKKSLDFSVVLNGYINIRVIGDSVWINKENLKFKRNNELNLHAFVIRKENNDIIIDFDDKTKEFVNVIRQEQTWPTFSIVIERGKAGLTPEQIEQRSFELHSLEIEEALK